MVGAINFLRDWVSICKKSRCRTCELWARGACVNQLEKMNDATISRTVHTVMVIKAQQNAEEGKK